MNPTTSSIRRHQLALPSVLAADLHSPKHLRCPTTPLAPPAHASGTASRVVASASNSTAVDPAAAILMRRPAHLPPKMSCRIAQAAAKALWSVDSRLTLSSIGRLKLSSLFVCLLARKTNPVCAMLNLRNDGRWCILYRGITFLTTITLYMI